MNYYCVYVFEFMLGIQYCYDLGIQWYKGIIILLVYGYENVCIFNGFLVSLRGCLNVFKLLLGGVYVYFDLVVNLMVNIVYFCGVNEIKLFYIGKFILFGFVFIVFNDMKVYMVFENIDGDGVFLIVFFLKKL